MAIFKNFACGFVDDRPDKVFAGVGWEGPGLVELLCSECIPPPGWRFSGWGGCLGFSDDAVDYVCLSDIELVLTR